MAWQTPFRRMTCMCDNSYEDTGCRHAINIKFGLEVYFTMQFMESRFHGKTVGRESGKLGFHFAESTKPQEMSTGKPSN